MPFDPPGSFSWLFWVTRRGTFPGVSVKGLKIFEVDSLDVTADTAFGKAQSHPGFKSSDDARLHFGMFIEIVVQTIGEGVH